MESWKHLLGEHFLPSAVAETWQAFNTEHRASAERAELLAYVVRKGHEADLATLEDKSAVLGLRDWICERVAMSRRKKPLSPHEIRGCMDSLRAAEPVERSALALKYCCEQAGECANADAEVDALLIQRWLSQFAERTELLPPSLQELVAKEGLCMRTTSYDTLLALSSALRIPVLSALKLALAAKTKSLKDFLAEYAAQESTDTWLGAILQASSTPADIPDQPSDGSKLPPLSEMALVFSDGRIRHGSVSISPPRVCHELGYVVAASGVPLSDGIVAILQDTTTRRRTVLWTLSDSNSYAILDDFNVESERHNAVDVQLTQEGDLLVQTCARGKGGTAQGPLSTFCVRMVGGDVSTLHHVALDEAAMDRLLRLRKEAAIINHMDHGNLLTLERTPDGHRTWYAGQATPLNARPIAIWGNPYCAYVWERNGSAVECTRTNGGWAYTHLENGEMLKDLVCAIHLINM